MTKPTSTYNTGLILKALAFAAHKHRDQKRKDVKASPYINHPIALADVLCNEGGITDENVLCAALLHDTVEDTKTTSEELTQVFGKLISGIVMEVTDNKRIAKAKRKHLQIEHAAHASHQAKLVKLADKISNLRDIVASPPVGWNIQRKQKYFDWAKEVIDQVSGTNADLEMIFDGIYKKGPTSLSNHDMMASAVKNYRGKVLETSQIKKIVLGAFPNFNEGSFLPNDHAFGNKSCCSCVGTKRQIFDRIEPGKYLVR